MNLKDKTVVIDNKTYHYSKIVLLENNERSNLRLSNINKLSLELYIQGSHYNGFSHLFQHLYFLSSDEICEGDWYYSEIHNQIFQCKHSEQYFENEFKVISSTDPSLNLPKPSDSFLQVYIDAYNKGGKIEDVLVEMVGKIHNQFSGTDAPWVEYLPKTTKGEITIRKVKDSWSREEVKKLLNKALEFKRPCYEGYLGLKSSWIKSKTIFIEENL